MPILDDDLVLRYDNTAIRGTGAKSSTAIDIQNFADAGGGNTSYINVYATQAFAGGSTGNLAISIETSATRSGTFAQVAAITIPNARLTKVGLLWSVKIPVQTKNRWMRITTTKSGSGAFTAGKLTAYLSQHRQYNKAADQVDSGKGSYTAWMRA